MWTKECMQPRWLRLEVIRHNREHFGPLPAYISKPMITPIFDPRVHCSSVLAPHTFKHVTPRQPGTFPSTYSFKLPPSPLILTARAKAAALNRYQLRKVSGSSPLSLPPITANWYNINTASPEVTLGPSDATDLVDDIESMSIDDNSKEIGILLFLNSNTSSAHISFRNAIGHTHHCC
jgi:hypothetical protein